MTMHYSIYILLILFQGGEASTDDEVKAILGVAVCNHCKKAFLQPRDGNTTKLKRHLTSCRKMPDNSTTQLRLTEVSFTSSNSTENKNPLNKTQKEVLVKNCAQFITTDLRPMTTIYAPGFQLLADHLILLGHAHRGNIKWASIRPSKKKLRQGIIHRGNSVAKVLAVSVAGAMAQYGCAFTTDLWTDTSNRHSYMPVTCHWFDNLGFLQEALISFKLWKADENKTGVLIRGVLGDVFRELGISSFVHRAVFVSDRGSNIIKAFENSGEIHFYMYLYYISVISLTLLFCIVIGVGRSSRARQHEFSEAHRLSCASHFLNNLQTALFKPSILKAQCQVLQDLIQGCYNILRAVRVTKLHARMRRSLKKYVQTRWNSHVAMFQSIKNNFDDLQAIESSTSPGLLQYVSLANLELIIAFLKTLKAVSDLLEASNYPTLFMVPMTYEYLMDFTAFEFHPEVEEDVEVVPLNVTEVSADESEDEIPNDEDEEAFITSLEQEDIDTDLTELSGDVNPVSEVGKYLSQRTNVLLRTQWQLHDIHYLALYLCPYTKSFASFVDGANEKRASTKQFGRLLLKHLKYAGTTSPKQSSAKKIRPNVVISQPSSLFASQRFLNMKESSAMDEFDRYDDLSVPPTLTQVIAKDHYSLCKALASDLMGWWRAHSESLPILSKLATLIHCIPASSAPSERVNSYAKLISHDRRGNVSPQLMESTLIQKFGLKK